MLYIIQVNSNLKHLPNQELKNTVTSVLGLPTDAELEPADEQPLATISVSKVFASKLRTISDDLFVLCAEGDQKDLPRLLIYHDPRNVCIFQSFTANISLFKHLIDRHWQDGAQTQRKVAKHFVYLKSSTAQQTINIPFAFGCDTDVRFKDSYKCAALQIWSHDRKSKALINHLQSRPEFIDWVCSLKNTSESGVRDAVTAVFDDFFKEEQLPTSFKYATIHFQLARVAGPNQLGAEDRKHNQVQTSGASNRRAATLLHMKNDNAAHIKFTDAGPYRLAVDEIVKCHLPLFLENNNQ